MKNTQASAFDLHVLSTPPAFVLSQDQTLRQKTLNRNHNHNDHGIPADTQHPKETGKTPQSIRPSTKKTNSWYQQTRHTIELTNNKPLLDTLRVRGRLRSASLGEIGTAGQIRFNPGVLLETHLAISCSREFILAHPRPLTTPWNCEG